MIVNGDSSNKRLGVSAKIKGDKVSWHVPSGEQIDFCASLLDQVALSPLRDLGNASGDLNLKQWRKCLRLLRYSLRGCIGLLLDDTLDSILSRKETDVCPREMATAFLIKSASAESQQVLNGLRHKLCLMIIDMQSLIVTETVGDNSSNHPSNGLMGMDPKICKEVCELADLLLTRRGAHHKSANALSVWKGQHQILSDFVLTSESDYIVSVRSRDNDTVLNGANDFYYDGEGE